MNTITENSMPIKKTSINFYFLSLLILEAVLTVIYIVTNTIPGGHDGFMYFSLQYYFLNNVIQSGEIPQWAPFMTQGYIVNYPYALQASFMQNIWLLLPDLSKHIPFITIFHLNILFDKIVLLAGVWLWGKHLNISKLGLFFSSLTLSLSNIWMLQISFNFHFYYCLPLLFYFIHQFHTNGKWHYIYLVFILTVMQIFGAGAYQMPVVGACVSTYAILLFFTQWKQSKSVISNLRFNLIDSFGLILTVGMATAMYLSLKIGTNQIFNFTAGRNADMSLKLNDFLTYAGNTDLHKWLELILGISPAYDFTLYIGIICLPMILIALLNFKDRKSLPLKLTAIIFILFGMGTIISQLYYYSFPLMKFYRHLSLTSPIIKLFLCILAGLGLDQIIVEVKKINIRKPFSLWILLSCMLLLTFFIIKIFMNPPQTHQLIERMIDPAGLPRFSTDSLIINQRFIFLIIIAILVTITSSVWLSFKHFPPAFIIIVILLFQFIDLTYYHALETKRRTLQLELEQKLLLKYQPVPYNKSRSINPSNSSRMSLIAKFPVPSLFYEMSNLFFFNDQAKNEFRLERWMKPLNDYKMAYWKQLIKYKYGKDLEKNTETIASFPLHHPSILNTAGINREKIQFYASAFVHPDKEMIAQAMTHPAFMGNALLIEGSADEIPNSKTLKINSTFFNNYSLDLVYEVTKFDSNSIEISVDNPYENTWLYYADVWHPFWKASINQIETKVYKADLAYKAIALKKGKNLVNLHFYFSKLASIQWLINVCSLGWLFLILYYCLNLTRNSEELH